MRKEMIEISKGFQSSVNIEYDFNDKRKIKDFIPTNACLEIIENIMISTEDASNSRAKILTGAYGRGKSLCVMIALSILFNSNMDFKPLIGKIKKCNEELAQRIKNYTTANKRMLPVIISGNSSSMTQAFLNALQKSLSLNDLSDIMPETHFQSAINTINRWKNDYPNTYDQFISLLNESIDEFIEKLSDSDVETYKKFTDIYPELSAGGMFNPFFSSNVVDIYDNVNTEIKKRGYCGIFIVYDEFGKYLESNISTATDSETKMLQDLAEKCNRTSSQQLHLMLICHKDISNYIDMNLPQDKVDGWRGISGRFEHINLTNNFSQMYEIISHTIKKTEYMWNEFKAANEAVFSSLYTLYNGSSMLGGKEELVIDGCYPLHPVTTFLLPRLSERVAQNERTLFTFLSSNQKNTLRQFVDNTKDELDFITPDYLYDYFENELRKELNSSDIHKVYSLSAKILRNFSSDSLSAKIIKCIAVIHFVQQFELLAPITDVFCYIYSVKYDSKEVIDCIQNLINEQYILYRKLSNSFLCLKETSGIDINEEIDKRTASIIAHKTEQQIIDECVNVKYLYPTAYNDDKCITRYFEICYVTLENYISEIKKEMPYKIAGKVFAVFNSANQSFDDFTREVYRNISTNARHMTIVPSYATTVVSSLAKYLAIKELREESADDSILFDEYSLYLDDYSEIVSDFTMSFISPELKKSQYCYEGKTVNIRRKSQLSERLSEICRTVYSATPVINNESLNKDKLPSVAINSRAKILTALLESDEISENLGLKGSGQDVSFMRSSLIQTGILVCAEEKYSLNTDPADANLKNVLSIIKEFFRSTIETGEKSFSELYNTLTNPEYGIGLKKGVIPIYIAVILNAVKKDLIFKQNGNEIRLTSDLLNAINERPELYSVVMEDWNDEKSVYLSKLNELFVDFVHEREKSFNSFSYIVGAINRWYLSVPKCSREMSSIYDTDKAIAQADTKFINSLKKPITNSRDYLLLTLSKIYASEPSKELADKLSKIKDLLDDGKNSLVRYVSNVLKETFGATEGVSLNSVLTEWYENLKPETKQHLFANNENAILNLISTITNDEFLFAERIGKAITGLRLNDWNNTIAQNFRELLEAFKNSIEEFDRQADSKTNNAIQQFTMIITDDDGVERTRYFEKVEYSSRANLLYQDITAAIEEMGQSITEQEKRQVLIDILSKLCE